MSELKKNVGQATSRIDGFLKVTGTATYATDYQIQNTAYAVIFKSAIAAGKIIEIDASEAEKAAGVLAVITHKNSPKLNEKGGIRGGGLLQSPNIEFHGQHIGVVVAETFEQARYAARLVKVKYEKADAKVDFEKHEKEAVLPKDRNQADAVRGDVEAAFRNAEYKLEAVYDTPIEHHNPMEPHATIAFWEGEKVTLYNGSQIVNGAQMSAAATLNIKPENVRIITPHIGGGFGSKGGQWANLVLAAVAAKMVNRPVKLALTRQQMFNSVGLRQRNRQKIRLAATRDGKLTALAHETTTHCAINGEFVEPCGDCSKVMYDTPNSLISYRVVPMNIILPTYTRGPGKSTGSFALESAIDELAYQLKIDPIEFRLKNEPAKDPSNGKPWSSRKTVECLKEGAKAFGWERRKIEPRQNRQGNYFIGYGVAAGTYPARQRETSATVKLRRDGNEVRASVELAASDLGTGTHTILAQTAADALGLPVGKIGVRIGDSDLPPAAGSVGSVGAASFANAVNDACIKITDELIAKSGKQFFARPTAAEMMISENIGEFQTRVDAKPPTDADKYSTHSFNANFAEVWVNDSTGMVRVQRFLAVTGAGKILNPKTAHSQIIGGNIWGIGMALHEESVLDPRWGNFVTRSFADYHVPSNLDIGKMETIFINEEDTKPNKLGIKGIGEVGIVGVAAAVANAVFNATGKRVRNLPITPDKLFVSKELREILDKLHETPQFEPIVLATVVDVRGSSYRLPGARMLVDGNGKSLGTISGGCLEADILERTRKVLQTGVPQIVAYDTRDNENSVFGLQMGCNGVIRVLLESGRDNRLFDFVESRFSERRSGVAATLIAAPENFASSLGTRCFFGDENFAESDFSGLELSAELNLAAQRVLESKRSRCEIFQTPGGDVEFFIELIAPPVSLLVFGAGFDALPVAGFAKNLGWRVSVIDHRPLFASKERFPDADEVLVLPTEDLPENLALDENSAAVVMTHNYTRDREILRFLLESKSVYVGALGPKRRTEKLLEELKADGANFSGEQLKKLFAPVGLDIGAKTPEAIALSIIAEIQSVLNNREGGFLRRRENSIYER